jgi:hypothetical protein
MSGKIKNKLAYIGLNQCNISSSFGNIIVKNNSTDNTSVV